MFYSTLWFMNENLEVIYIYIYSFITFASEDAGAETGISWLPVLDLVNLQYSVACLSLLIHTKSKISVDKT